MLIPKNDGEVTAYRSIIPIATQPRIYYVNGIQNDGRDHAQTATALSALTEHQIIGIYNATAGKGAGIILDLLQCGADWIDVFLSKIAEWGNIGINFVINHLRDFVRDHLNMGRGDPVNMANAIRQKLSLKQRLALIEGCVSTYNKATASLFHQLNGHLGSSQIIIAHSQGNLITADALWSMVICHGEQSLDKMRVYSLASPAPAWPLGIRHRRKVYGHTNDLVTLADPHNWLLIDQLAHGMFGRTAGDWRRYGKSWVPGLAGHDLGRNMALNFSTTIRRDLGLPPIE